MNHDPVLLEAIEKFGIPMQINVAIEEFNECSVALLHYRRAKASREQVVSEIADVIIMARQLAFIFGHEDVDHAVLRKVERLREALTLFGKPSL